MLLALLLLALPLELTLQKLLLLPELAERSHQLLADPKRVLQNVTAYKVVILLAERPAAVLCGHYFGCVYRCP